MSGQQLMGEAEFGGIFCFPHEIEAIEAGIEASIIIVVVVINVLIAWNLLEDRVKRVNHMETVLFVFSAAY